MYYVFQLLISKKRSNTAEILILEHDIETTHPNCNIWQLAAKVLSYFVPSVPGQYDSASNSKVKIESIHKLDKCYNS